MNQAKARTTKKDARYRLLLLGIALLMRQVWVWLSAQLAVARGLGQQEWVMQLPLAEMLEWLAFSLQRAYPKVRSVPLGRTFDSLPLT